jgi:hypothetical protein
VKDKSSGLWDRYWKTVVAVVGGNALYYGLLARHLPPAARHRLYQIDWGLVVDFWICLAIYGLLAFTFKSNEKQ